MLIFFGQFRAFKKPLFAVGNEVLYRYYIIAYFLIFPVFWQRRIGLLNNQGEFEFDTPLENKLLKLSKDAKPEEYLKIINDYKKEQHEKQVYQKTHKVELEKKDNKEFTTFLKWVGIIIGLLLLAFLIKVIFFA